MSDKTLNIKGTLMSLSTPVVMGILNVTPDSFYAGSRKQTEADIEERIQAILSEGGQIIDIGGYSSRPDAEEVSPEEEMERLAFALKILNAHYPEAVVSVDTFRADVARKCVAWHMYDMGPYEGGPNATTITFTPGEGAVLEGGVEQLTRPERHYDKTFGMEIGTFARKAQFAQSVKLSAPQATVKAELAWMICNDTSCLPPDDTELTITLPAAKFFSNEH